MSHISDLGPALALLVVLACAAQAILRNVPSIGRARECPMLWQHWFAWRPVAVSGVDGWIWIRPVLRRRGIAGWEYTRSPEGSGRLAGGYATRTDANPR